MGSIVEEHQRSIEHGTYSSGDLPKSAKNWAICDRLEREKVELVFGR